ncbi:MAG TPA: cytochrome c biogenesis protein CcsA [Candidatus Dormibacteraeota bacterium]|jgi:heme exporter protein C
MTKYTRLAGAAVLLMLVSAALIFFYAPEDYLQKEPQRIFYLHVSAAIAAFACFAVVLGASIAYLRTESARADRLARAAALVGVVLTTVTLVMGMLYAKPIWGTFWTWDARLTSTLVLWIVYAGYLLLRRLADPGRQVARLAAVVGIFGFVDVPIVYFSVTWWRTQHPGPVIVSNALPPQMLLTFLVTMACTFFLAAVLVGIRYRIETLMDEAPSPAGARVAGSSQREPELAR